MKDNLKTFCGTINIRQILISITVLTFGSLVYLSDRSPDLTYFVYKSGINISFYNTLPNLFGIIGNCLPTFTHVFSLILITAGLISFQKRGCRIICLSWFLVDCAFELGQKYKSLPLKIIPDWFDGILFLENAKNYFLRGTFDFIDLAVIALGAVIAYLVLLTTTDRRAVL